MYHFAVCGDLLSQLRRCGPCPPPGKVLALLAPTVCAMEYMWAEQHLLPMDVKAANVLVLMERTDVPGSSGSGRQQQQQQASTLRDVQRLTTVLSDVFPAALVGPGGTAELPSTQAVAYTQACLAPDQLMRFCGPRLDCRRPAGSPPLREAHAAHSIGVLFFEALTGRMPYCDEAAASSRAGVAAASSVAAAAAEDEELIIMRTYRLQAAGKPPHLGMERLVAQWRHAQRHNDEQEEAACQELRTLLQLMLCTMHCLAPDPTSRPKTVEELLKLYPLLGFAVQRLRNDCGAGTSATTGRQGAHAAAAQSRGGEARSPAAAAAGPVGMAPAMARPMAGGAGSAAGPSYPTTPGDSTRRDRRPCAGSSLAQSAAAAPPTPSSGKRSRRAALPDEEAEQHGASPWQHAPACGQPSAGKSARRSLLASPKAVRPGGQATPAAGRQAAQALHAPRAAAASPTKHDPPALVPAASGYGLPAPAVPAWPTLGGWAAPTQPWLLQPGGMWPFQPLCLARLVEAAAAAAGAAFAPRACEPHATPPRVITTATGQGAAPAMPSPPPFDRPR